MMFFDDMKMFSCYTNVEKLCYFADSVACEVVNSFHVSKANKMDCVLCSLTKCCLTRLSQRRLSCMDIVTR